MQIKYENIVLRDMIESDIEDYVRWWTTEIKWMNYDAPWETEASDEETERTSWREYYESVKDIPDDVRRWKFEIEWNGRHIGWVSSYMMDENYEWISADTIQPGQRFIVPSVLISANPMCGVTVLAQTLFVRL